ncbi:MAG: cation:proton antiporter [Bacteroidales bacterium]|nr:cation:proton antiporter [Bacteroidales bacterium]MDD4430764.1 cation:proton antiporter [Bacteroidales bacterium]
MDISIVLIVLGLLIFFSHTFNALFSRTRIPNVLLLMLIGLLIGPILKLISPQDLGKLGTVFTTITLIAILFESGIGLELKVLKKALLGASLITIFNFGAVMLIGVFIGNFILKLDWLHSLFLGAALGGTSAAVVIPTINQLNPNPRAKTVLYLESAFSDILCLVVALALLAGIQTGELSVSGILNNMWISILFAIIIGVVLGTIWIVILKKYLSGMKNTMFTTFALAFILYGFCEHIGLNGGLSILAFGITAGNIGTAGFIRKLFTLNEESVLNQQERNFYSEIVFVLQTYFFVYIGICVQLNNAWHLLIGFLFVVLAFALRPLVTFLLGKKDLDARDKKLINALGPKGLVAAVLASLPLQYALDLKNNLLSGSASVQNPMDLLPPTEAFINTPAPESLLSQLPAEGNLMDSLGSRMTSDSLSPVLADIGPVDSLSVLTTVQDSLSGLAAQVDPLALARADEMIRYGLSIQNVSYAVVLISIILSSIWVNVIERKNKTTLPVEDTVGPEHNEPQNITAGEEGADSELEKDPLG